MAAEFQVVGENVDAPFTLKVHRGDGMALLAMNWKDGPPPNDFVGFAIEYRPPDADRYCALKNRIGFAGRSGKKNLSLSTRLSPIQKFRWVHFPRNAHVDGAFTYRVTPVFMNELEELSYGEAQTARLELRRETYPGKLNVAFTRGFVSSQAFVDRYDRKGKISTLLPSKADLGLTFKPTHSEAKEALTWMGFEGREAIIDVLDQAIASDAEVRVVAYDLSIPEVVDRLVKLGDRLKIIIDDSGSHRSGKSAESQATKRLKASAGANNVLRQHMGSLQHNKTIVVDGTGLQLVVCGSTNFSWRGFYVQANNAIVLRGKAPVALFSEAFDNYWLTKQTPFSGTASAEWASLGLKGIDAQVSFSPHNSSNALLDEIAADVGKTKSSLFYSLAFLYQTRGPLRDAVDQLTEDGNIFVYGISDKEVGGIELQKPDGSVQPVYPSALTKTVPRPFSKEPTGGGGNRMHHKFLVIDFDKPTARVYMGSYNFSNPADVSNGENLLLIKDRRIAVSYVVEALRIFDHYHFRVSVQEAKDQNRPLELAKPPQKRAKPWWHEHYHNPLKIKDRELFA